MTALATTGNFITPPLPTNGSTSPFSGCQMAVPPGSGSQHRVRGATVTYPVSARPGFWAAARDAALARTFRGVPGHLATITSASENGIVGALRANGEFCGWIGLTDDIVNGTFTWVTANR